MFSIATASFMSLKEFTNESSLLNGAPPISLSKKSDRLVEDDRPKTLKA